MILHDPNYLKSPLFWIWVIDSQGRECYIPFMQSQHIHCSINTSEGEKKLIVTVYQTYSYTKVAMSIARYDELRHWQLISVQKLSILSVS